MTQKPTRRSQVVLVGGKIRQLRKERHLTQADLASRIGIQQSDLCRMETGEYKVSLEVLFRILAVFGLEIGEFFRDEYAPSTPSDRENEILRLYRQLDERAQNDVLDYVRFKGLRRLEIGPR